MSINWLFSFLFYSWSTPAFIPKYNHTVEKRSESTCTGIWTVFKSHRRDFYSLAQNLKKSQTQLEGWPLEVHSAIDPTEMSGFEWSYFPRPVQAVHSDNNSRSNVIILFWTSVFILFLSKTIIENFYHFTIIIYFVICLTMSWHINLLFPIPKIYIFKFGVFRTLPMHGLSITWR